MKKKLNKIFYSKLMDFKPTFDEIYQNEINQIKRIKGHLNALKADTIKEM